MASAEVAVEREDFYILTTSVPSDDRTRVLKNGDTFAIFDRFGDIGSASGELGVFHQDTRFLSRMQLRMEKERPLLLSSTIKDDNGILAVDLMNPDFWYDGQVVIPHGTVHIVRSIILWQGTCFQRFRIHNYGASAVDLALSVEFDADFADIFEVRGTRRERRGRRLPTRQSGAELMLAYEGLDGHLRRTQISFDPGPTRLAEAEAQYRMRLEPRTERAYEVAISCLPRTTAQRLHAAAGDDDAARARTYEQAVDQAAEAMPRVRAMEPEIVTSNEHFNRWLNRSLADLHMMRTETAHGPYPYAGVPWFSTAFGRDGILTALQCLWYSPEIARGVLQYLAATQAQAEHGEQDAQPGKILHETRAGEMAALGEVPFGRYYGSVDATPLFVVLAGAYLQYTADVDFARSLWPNVERALAWIDRYGDSDGDGFVDYSRLSAHGLVNQGWKDSHDAVFHADGTTATPPIALCEVQGYVHAARLAGAEMARAMGFDRRANELASQAEQLRTAFNERFWCEDLSTYALAIDGSGRPCRVRASNAGHCLAAGIADEVRAARVAATLMSPTSFSGWGIRTLATTESRYNPMSYHNGSVWPHDNALAAMGFARYGMKEAAATVLTGMFEASACFELHRLPELFCGFPRRPGENPTQYPVSCAPQAWAAAVVLAILQACLGLEVKAAERKVVLSAPMLPNFLKEVRIERLKVMDGSVDLLLSRHGLDVGVNVLRREGTVGIVVLK